MLDRELKGPGREKWGCSQGSLFKEKPSEQKPKSGEGVSHGKIWDERFQMEKTERAKTAKWT